MKRIIILYTAFALAVWGLNLRIATLIEPENHTVYASHTQKTITVSESRGYIYDRNYIPLVNEKRIHMAAILPYDGVETDIRDNTDADETEKVSRGKPCVITTYYRRGDSEYIKYFDITTRYTESHAPHLIGYTDSTGKKGLTGIEKSFDSLLNDCAGSIKVRFFTDGKGNALPDSKIEILNHNYDSKGGIRLTLDSAIQKLCNLAAEKYHLDAGAIVVLKVDTSEILAAASYPGFDPNDIASALNSEHSALIGRFLYDYAVGSVFKPITAAAALEKGIGTEYSYTCTGSIEIGGITFHCHKRDGHGILDMSGAMANSCNTYFISLASQIGAAPILAMANAMGIGKEIVLADGFCSACGGLPDKKELENAGGVANFAFGQGSLSATPLHLAAVYACIANNGLYTPPYLLAEQLNNNGDAFARFIPDAPIGVMSESTAGILQSLLLNTVENGSGQAAKPEHMTAAGKTATAQSGVYENGDEILRTWFCGYFPAENPQYAVAVLKENGGSPITDCAPIFKYIADHIEN